MTTNETMLELLEMIGPVELLDEDERPWRLTWDIDYWRWVPEPGRAASTMCRYPREAQPVIQQAAIEWLGSRVEIGIYSLGNGQWTIHFGGLSREPEHFCPMPLLEALHAAVEAVKESKDAEGD